MTFFVINSCLTGRNPVRRTQIIRKKKRDTVPSKKRILLKGGLFFPDFIILALVSTYFPFTVPVVESVSGTYFYDLSKNSIIYNPKAQGCKTNILQGHSHNIRSNV